MMNSKILRMSLRHKFLSGWILASLLLVVNEFFSYGDESHKNANVIGTFVWSISIGLCISPLLFFVLSVIEKFIGKAEIHYPGLKSEYFDEVSIPILDRQIEVKSHTDSKKTYLVDLKQQTCTCPDFVEKRSFRTIGTILRMCKHQIQAFESAEDTGLGKLLAATMGEFRREASRNLEWIAMKPKNLDLVVIVFPSKPKWMKIIAPSSHGKRRKKARSQEEPNYTVHFWCTTERRWGYRMIPANRMDCERAADLLAGNVETLAA